MTEPRKRKPISEWFGEKIPLGKGRNVELAIGESYSSMSVHVPIHIRRGKKDGPVVFITAALHGDEINGTGAIRQLIHDDAFILKKGAIIFAPVLNLLAFDRHSRYLPDRRDLNRSFPGLITGSLASRMAHIIFDEIVARSDYGIDLHTAAVRRTNYPTVRGDLSNFKVRKLAESFGSEIILDTKGPSGGLRREACKAGCPTIIMEGGEVWKVQPSIVESSTRGIKNVLSTLNMLDLPIIKPAYQVIVEKSKWIRAEHGGFMQFHVQPGDMIEKGNPLATNTTLLGNEQNILYAPFNAVVLGMTSLPAISPGEPICNLGKLPKKYRPEELRKMRIQGEGLETQISEDLGSSLFVVEPS